MEYIITFLSLFFIDAVNAFYIDALNSDRKIVASLWASILTVLGCIAVINYVNNHIMLIPAILGAFIGTYVGMKLRNK